MLTAVQNAVVAINKLTQVTNTVNTGLYATQSAYADLPAASSATGAIRYISNCNTDTRRAIAAGGGSNKVLVFSDGTNWLVL